MCLERLPFFNKVLLLILISYHIPYEFFEQQLKGGLAVVDDDYGVM